MSIDPVKAVREQLAALGHRSDHLSEEKLRQLIHQLKKALAAGEDVEAFLQKRCGDATPPGRD